MRAFTDDFLIDGQPMLAPDAQVLIRYEDIDGADAGRDQAGYLHRSMVRCKVPSWEFRYSHLTEAERQYMESLFGEKDSFTFTHPGRSDSAVPEQTACYRSKYTICWQNRTTGLWSNYGFTVTAL